MPWYVIYTKPKAELRATESLRKLNIEVYCPVVTEVRQWSDRKKKISTPLFKSYVFVHLEAKDRNQVFKVQGVVNYLFWLGKPAEVREAEIRTIKSWNENEEIDQMYVEKFTPGDRITIPSGLFKDQRAVIKHIGKKRMRLLLPSLGCAINVRIREVVA